MKILVISDVHSNLTALEAVIQSAGAVDAVWCLGDLVGYGPDPNECIDTLRQLPGFICVKGNHDSAVSGNKNIEQFNDEAGSAILLTRQMVTPENMEYLRNLPETLITAKFTLAHGSPRNPVWEYIIDSHSALANMEFIETPYALVGHSHLPIMFTRDHHTDRPRRSYLIPGKQIVMNSNGIFNPGSVGQPRDNDPRASYGIIDYEAMTWEIFRAEYDIRAVQNRIFKAGLPIKQAMRLAEGW